MKSSRRPSSQEIQSAEPVQETSLFPVVAIGASAGGLEAFTQLIRALPDNTGMAFVLNTAPGSNSSQSTGRAAFQSCQDSGRRGQERRGSATKLCLCDSPER